MGLGQEPTGIYFSVNADVTAFPKHLGKRESQEIRSRAPTSAVS